MRVVAQTLVALTYISLCAADISGKFQICKRTDPGINGCLKSAIQSGLSVLKNGLPQYGFPSMEPIQVSEWNIEPQPPLHLRRRYKNIELYNHSSTEIRDVKCVITDTDFSLTIKGYNPNILFASDYEFVNSSFGSIDISGQGKATYDHEGYDFDITMKGDILKKNNEDYLSIKTADLVMTAESFVVTYKSGDEERDNLINTFSVHHGLSIFLLVKHEYETIYAEAYRRLANIIFDLIPYNQLFPK